MNIGENIRIRRESLGISQVELAENVGISQAMLCQIERGTKNPSLQVGREIAKQLNCSMEELFDIPKGQA
ncbi:MAG: helix-turn-helix transcriptional regulator [Oscillospiraceae bacterium]|nr:helix-turn-helix transcriptional regulator [Oscillospiraceae bacterium]